jgi:2'-hydroxyisoflavone reductase
MKLLILGGTGFLGPEIVKTAQDHKHQITLFNRGKTHADLFPDVEKLHGDREKDEYDALKGREWDAVIDTSANVPAWVRGSSSALGKSVRQYLFVSTISVYPMESFERPGKDETAPVEKLPEGADEKKLTMELYGALKAKSEQVIRDAYGDHATIIRPGLIVGAGDYSDRFTYWPVRIEKGGEVLAPGSPDAKVQFIDARDLGAWIVKMVEDGHGGTYNATGPRDPLSMAEMLYGIKAITTAGAQFTWIPDDFLGKQSVGPWMEMPLWIPADPQSIGFSQLSIEKAVARGLTFRPLADTARDTLTFAKTRPANWKWRAGLSADKEQAVLKAWHDANPTTAPTTAPASTMPART